ncbi:oligoribonuclease [Geodermatophilus ruber]|uniref:Oligoribonuclease n=1 Tax=Geodermatophilus ruber TaxID=504800 RepID=A0A1I4E1W6_9ACTN|nr:oligoribonuclease [Geodermatophilus ruber]
MAPVPAVDWHRCAAWGMGGHAGGRGGGDVGSSDVADSAGHLVWIDCEMTGLDLTKDKLIEVAVLITDSDLNVLDPGLDLVIGADDADLEGMVDVVTEMHARSGLTEAVRASTLTVAEAEQRLLAYIKRFVPERRTAPLCGNSIGTDRGFLARDMPALDDHLHYRMIDVSSIKELARRWYPRVYFTQPAKGLAHRALADIIESVRELAYYRKTLFVEPPGPSSSEAQAAATEVTEEFAAIFAAEDADEITPTPPATSEG